MKKILVVGLGLIGGSLAMALRGFEDFEIVGTDRSPAVREQAADILSGPAADRAPRLEALDDACIARNLSPGGSADLLAAAMLLEKAGRRMGSGW